MSNLPPPSPGGPPPPPPAPRSPGSTPPPDGLRDSASPGRGSKVPWVLAALVVVGLVVAAVLVFAVGGDDGDSPPDLTEADLEAALLTTEAAGEGFTEDTDDEDNELDPDDLDTSEECRDLIEGFEAAEGDGVHAERELDRGNSGESVTHEIIVPGENTPEFGILDDIVGDCGEIGFDDGTFVGTMRIAEGEAVDVGDRSFRMDAELQITSPQAVTFQLVIVSWERDGVISSVELASPVGGEVDPALISSLPEVADERLVELLSSAD